MSEDIVFDELIKVKDSVLRYLNGDDTEEELMSICEIVRCPKCNHLVFEDELVYHKWDLSETEEKICEDCRGDEE